MVHNLVAKLNNESQSQRSHPDGKGRQLFSQLLAHLPRSTFLALVDNAVAPGLVLPAPDATEAMKTAMIRQVPLGRMGSLDDIVATVAFLLEGSDTSPDR